jgi:pyruvate/2-oxoglutarate/acetoin dehydrogenase E1 component
MSSRARSLRYGLAINEAFHHLMETDPSVVLIGQGVKSPWYVGNTARGLLERFGDRRVYDTPVSENAVTGAAVGAAMAGLRPVIVHPRMDFMLFAMDPIINQAANWRYMSGGAGRVPVVFWGIINRGGEQAAQHSQALHSIFAHVPGLKVVAPSTPFDAKGLLIAAVRDDDPVVFVDDRWLYAAEGPVPEEAYEVPIGEAVVRREGKDLTIIAFSYLAPRAMEAAERLEAQSIDCEVIDLRTLKPLDMATVAASVGKTRRAVVCDIGWRTGGIGAEIAAQICEQCWEALDAPPVRVALPDLPAPAARTLEGVYYPGTDEIAAAAQSLIQRGRLVA